MSSGVDDKVGAVETTEVRCETRDDVESRYGKTLTRPIFDEETGRGVDKPDPEIPDVDPVHIADGGESGGTEHENPNVVGVKTIPNGANMYFGLVKNKTKNVAPHSVEPTNTSFVVEVFVYIENCEGPHYALLANGNESKVISYTTTRDYNK